MGLVRRNRALLVGGATAATLLGVGITSNAILAHQVYKNAPPGMIIDYSVPLAIHLMIPIGFYGLITIALMAAFLFFKANFSK